MSESEKWGGFLEKKIAYFLGVPSLALLVEQLDASIEVSNSRWEDGWLDWQLGWRVVVVTVGHKG